MFSREETHPINTQCLESLKWENNEVQSLKRLCFIWVKQTGESLSPCSKTCFRESLGKVEGDSKNRKRKKKNLSQSQ